MQFIDQEGQTVEEALAAALAVLGKSPSEVEYEILEEGVPGETAVLIRVYPSNELLLDVRDALEGLLDALQLDGNVEATFESEDQIIALIETVDSGILIGHRGQTLDALQHIVNGMLKLENYHIIVDVADYRKRHLKQLEEIAKRMARQVISTRRPIELKPMTPADRRIIHLAVQTFPELTTQSVGEEPNRRIVIAPTNYSRPQYRRPQFRSQGQPGQGGQGGQGGGNRGRGGQGGGFRGQPYTTND